MCLRYTCSSYALLSSAAVVSQLLVLYSKPTANGDMPLLSRPPYERKRKEVARCEIFLCWYTLLLTGLTAGSSKRYLTMSSAPLPAAVCSGVEPFSFLS